MKNDMAEAMVNRYGNYLEGNDSGEEREIRTFSYWVMSTIESVFWGGRLNITDIELYVKDYSAVLLFENPRTAEKETFKYASHHIEFTKELLMKFKENFNNVKYHELKYKHTFFRAIIFSSTEESQSSPYFGHYQGIISVDMHTDTDYNGHKYA